MKTAEEILAQCVGININESGFARDVNIFRPSEALEAMEQYRKEGKSDITDDLMANGAVAKLVWSYLQYTSCQIDGNDATVIEIKHVYSLINDIMGFLKEQQQIIDKNVKVNMDLVKTIQRMINEEKDRLERTKGSGFPLI